MRRVVEDALRNRLNQNRLVVSPTEFVNTVSRDLEIIYESLDDLPAPERGYSFVSDTMTRAESASKAVKGLLTA